MFIRILLKKTQRAVIRIGSKTHFYPPGVVLLELLMNPFCNPA